MSFRSNGARGTSKQQNIWTLITYVFTMHHIFQTPYAHARDYDEVKNPNPQLQRGPKSCIFFAFTIK